MECSGTKCTKCTDDGTLNGRETPVITDADAAGDKIYIGYCTCPEG